MILYEDPLVSADWLKANIDAPDLRVIDATWFAPFQTTDGTARQYFDREHIPGSVYFDIDSVTAPDSSLPHMLPPSHIFSARVRKKGLGDGHRLVVYDRNNFFASARVWWMFRTMGKEDIRVLDGGLAAWEAVGGGLEDTPPRPTERHFTPRVRGDRVKTLDQVKAASEAGSAQIIDARPAGRFSGEAPEPRADLPSGHIPGSINVPGSALLTPHGFLKPEEELKAVFEAADVDLSSPIITSCGSGVTAAVTALALARLGQWDTSVYDGSWTEWASTDGCRVETS